MPTMVRCEGCKKTIVQENNSPILTPKTKRVIGYVHIGPKTANAALIPNCHAMAFRNLNQEFLDYPVLEIEGRELNKEIVDAVPKRRISGTHSAARYASKANGGQMFAIHSTSARHSPAMTSF